MNKDCSYYEMFLKVILHEIKSPLASDTVFIEERARAAEKEIERQRLPACHLLPPRKWVCTSLFPALWMTVHDVVINPLILFL